MNLNRKNALLDVDKAGPEGWYIGRSGLTGSSLSARTRALHWLREQGLVDRVNGSGWWVVTERGKKVLAELVVTPAPAGGESGTQGALAGGAG